MEWHRTKGVEENDFSEKVMLVYLDHLLNKYAPSSIWCFYSMLRSSIKYNYNVDIDYPKVILVLGIYGATCADELTKLVLKDIEVQG
ncbi:hypothetical protein Bhyg_07687, partial [Pseudolycoriella hygida]